MRAYRSALLPLLAGAVGLALLVHFDLGPGLAFNDDWMYAWSARQLSLGHGLHLFPEASPTALVQIFWGAAASLGRAGPQLLRLSALPFLLLGSWSSARLALGLGADRFWSAVAAVALLGAPFYMGTVTGFMTEGFYIGLLLAAAALCAAWLRTGQRAPAATALVVLATLERQLGGTLPLALTAGLLLARRRRPVGRGEWAWLALLWLLTIAVLLLPWIAGFATPNMRAGGGGPMAPQLGALALGLLRLPLTWGLVSVPFLVGLASQPAVRSRLAFLIAAAWISAAFVVFRTFGDSNGWTTAGLNPVTIANGKPQLFAAVIPVFGLLGGAAFLAPLLRRRGGGGQLLRRPDVLFLLLVAFLHLLPLLQLRMHFRYYLPSLALVVPLLAALATAPARPRVAATWAVLSLVAGLAVYAAGEQDYQAWQVARDRAAQEAFATTPRDQVDGGYEVYAVYVEVPMFEATGHLPGPVGDFVQPSLHHGRRPVTLYLAGARDPGVGVPYVSAAPGKVITIRAP